MNINNVTGSPVVGNDFYGREKELDFAWKHIKKGNSLLLSAPRRVGKSSFAKKLLSYAEKEQWNTLEINLEEIKSEEGFVKLFIEKLKNESWWQQLKSNTSEVVNKILESIKTNVEYEGFKTSIEWQSKKIDIYEQLKNLLDHENEILIMVDELTILLNSFLENDKEHGKQNVEFFLNWLRSFRQQSNTKIHWVFCSSVGIDSFTNLHGLSYTFNDVEPFALTAFPPKTARSFLISLAESETLNFSEELIIYILEKVTWHLPYFIQILFFNIHRKIKVADRPLAASTVDEAFTDLINGKHLNTWDERLKDYHSLEKYARLLLTGLSKVTAGEHRDLLLNRLNAKINDIDEAENKLSKLLNMLKNDGYLDITPDDKYLFRSPLLKAFWFNRFAR